MNVVFLLAVFICAGDGHSWEEERPEQDSPVWKGADMTDNRGKGGQKQGSSVHTSGVGWWCRQSAARP